MSKIGVGLIGPGFIAEHHIDAVRRLGDAEVIAIAGSNQASTQRKADQWKIDTAYGSFEDLIADPRIQVIHNTTPSYLHLPVSLAALRAEKHVISDKPLALTVAECRELTEAAAAAGVANVVTFNYRGNPLVQQARQMIADGEIGPVVFLHGQYLQDWMTDDRVYSWRMDPSKGGSSSALSDIGSHWCDLAEHVSGLRIDAVLSDLSTVVPTRYASNSTEAFSSESTRRGDLIRIDSEDTASVLLRFSNGARGSLRVGQVLPGHKNDLQLEINGRKRSLRWLQERQNELWIGSHESANQILDKDPSLMSPSARPYANLPGGHQEGWADAFRNIIADAYQWIRDGGAPSRKPSAVCDFANASRICRIVEAMLQSHSSGGVWIKVDDKGEDQPTTIVGAGQGKVTE